MRRSGERYDAARMIITFCEVEQGEIDIAKEMFNDCFETEVKAAIQEPRVYAPAHRAW